MGKVTGLYGDGGTGKTTIAMQLAVAVALGEPFLGMETKQGRVYALLAENDDTDSHISLDSVCRSYDASLGNLRGKMRIASRDGCYNVLQSFRRGEPEHSDLFNQLLSAVKSIGPVLVVLDTAADLFGGNENERAQVSAFIKACCGRIANETGATVVLCAHPSLEGLRSGRGSAGSTAWNNALRARLYLWREIDDHGGETDPDYRELELMKANFARKGMVLSLRFEDGVFVPCDGPVKTDRKIANQELILAEVARAFDAGEPWSGHPQARGRWLGHWIMQQNFRKNKRHAQSIVDQLVSRGSIVDLEYDKHGHRKGLCLPEQARNWRARKSRDEAKRLHLSD
jgi:RecA-family ATPase